MDFFDYHLQKMVESGVFYRIYNQYSFNPTSDFSGIDEAIALGYDNVVFPFLLIAAGTAIGFGLAIAERIGRWWKWKRRSMEDVASKFRV